MCKIQEINVYVVVSMQMYAICVLGKCPWESKIASDV